MAGPKLVACVQNTTALDLNHLEASSFGPLSYEAGRGIYAHPTYGVSTSRKLLGVLDTWKWEREAKVKDASRLSVKESLR